MTIKCEWCGRFGATRGTWIDPRYAEFMTLEFCPKCWREQNAWAEELKQNMTPEQKERSERAIAFQMQRRGIRI